MKARWSTRGRFLFACAAALLLTGFNPKLAAQNNPPPLLSVRIVQVKPDKVAEWEGLQKELSAAMKKAGATRTVWQVVRGDLNTYHIVEGLAKYADLDEPASPPMEAAAWASWQARVLQCVGNRQLLIARTNPDLSIPLKKGRKINLLLLTWRKYAPGRGGDYQTALAKELFPALKKAGINGYFENQIVAGHRLRTWVSARYIDKWADLDGPGLLSRALGENSGKLASKLGSMIVDVERMILRIREDLSASATN